MTSACSSGRRRAAQRLTRMLARAVFAGIALVAFSISFAPPGAKAETPATQLCLGDTAQVVATPVALSRPVEMERGIDWEAAAFRGLSCSRCNSATQFCVLNPVRYEYACAPLGTVACISASSTHWCPAGRGCWAGRCR